jgi:hypothetical protein
MTVMPPEMCAYSMRAGNFCLKHGLKTPRIELDRSDTDVHGVLKPQQVDKLFKYVEYVQYAKYVEYV